MKSPNTYWPLSDLERLAQLYPTATEAALLAAFPGRTLAALRYQAHQLGSKRACNWTEADIATLRAEYPTQGPTRVGRLVGRPARSVQHKAAELGLVRPRLGVVRPSTRGLPKAPPWSGAEARLLQLLYGTAPDEELVASFPGRTLYGIRKHAATLALPRYRYWTAERVALLREHYPVVGGTATATLLGIPAARVHRKASALQLRGPVKPPRPAAPPKAPKPPKPAPAPKPPKAAATAAIPPAGAWAGRRSIHLSHQARAKPAAAPLVPNVKKPSVATPNLNAQKAKKQKKAQQAATLTTVSVEYIKKLPYAHPERMAYVEGGTRKWAEYMKQQQQQAA